MKKILTILFIFVLSAAYAQNKTNITILDATVKDKTVPGVELIFQKSGESSVKVMTGADGKATINTPFNIDDNSVMMITSKDGYSSMAVKCPCDGYTYAISPKMQELDGMRVVLTWGKNPEDLDSHLVYEGNHIYWDKKIGSKANLDVDDTDSYGPETITVEKKKHGVKYIYAVHDYTDRETPGTRNLSNSNAKVFVYIGSTLIKTYYIPQNKTGNLWAVFAIDENSNIVDINDFSSSRGMDFVRNDIAKFMNLNSAAAASETAIKRSKEINALGEKAYHAGNLSESASYYREAIDINPNNGQAYSNLGLSYQKMGNIAEAIWANRKAIDLADGANKNTIKASSFYNIARIYESQNKYEDALQHYKWALENKEHKAYREGIARMEEKLK